MAKGTVYFTDFRTKPGTNMLDKLEKLVRKAGIEKIDFDSKFTAIKIHFGEPGNLAYIRPNYAARIVSVIKDLKGNPYLTDSNTLYKGRRSNAPDHLLAAFENGFNPMAVGCNVIIADGLRGYDFNEIEINSKHCKTAKIGQAIAQADIIISMNHFKGHEMTGFGGALKNLGMGSGSRAGKMEMHSGSKPRMKKSNCTSCGVCIKNCSQDAISFDSSKKAEIDYDKCIGCGQCIFACRFDAARVVWGQSADISNEMIAEYALAVMKGKPGFHINFIMDVSPDCDCFSNNDMPIVPNIGIAASFDPVALDRACADLVNKAPAMKNSRVDVEDFKEGDDKFTCVHPETDWRVCLNHAEAIGLGNNEYELVVVK
ncbi:MAG: DUF362 domain-containing protein [Clostridiales bacterium]|nr:DUF362 domain-containing protein [Clostridiales bacterium]